MSGLIESLEQQSSDQRAADQAVYNELVCNDEGKAADVKRLDQARQRLGKSIDDMRADQAILRKAKTLEAKAAGDTEEAEEQLQTASDVYRDFVAETERIIQERKAEEATLWGEFQARQRGFTLAREASVSLAALRRTHWELFGVDAPAPEPAPQPHYQIVPPVNQVRPSPPPVAHPRMDADGGMHWGPGAQPQTGIQTFGLPEPRGKNS